MQTNLPIEVKKCLGLVGIAALAIASMNVGMVLADCERERRPVR